MSSSSFSLSCLLKYCIVAKGMEGVRGVVVWDFRGEEDNLHEEGNVNVCQTILCRVTYRKCGRRDRNHSNQEYVDLSLLLPS